VWRMYSSGQFIMLRGFKEDQQELPGGRRYLGVMETLFLTTELFEFASRLASAIPGADDLTVECGARGLAGRYLYIESPRRAGFDWEYQTQADGLENRYTLSRPRLIANARQLALEPATAIFARFGWAARTDLLAGIQEELSR